MTTRALTDKCSESIYRALQEDLVSMGEAIEIIKSVAHPTTIEPDLLRDVITSLLTLDVQIGTAMNPTGEYVEFIAWKGSNNLRIDRAFDEMASQPEDGRFSVWFALRDNVDKFES